MNTKAEIAVVIYCTFKQMPPDEELGRWFAVHFTARAKQTARARRDEFVSLLSNVAEFSYERPDDFIDHPLNHVNNHP